MRESLIVSTRGQITLPVTIRKRLGIVPGGVVIVEVREDEVALRPAAVLAIETYSDLDIARWEAEDRLEAAERRALLKKFKVGAATPPPKPRPPEWTTPAAALPWR